MADFEGIKFIFWSVLLSIALLKSYFRPFSQEKLKKFLVSSIISSYTLRDNSLIEVSMKTDFDTLRTLASYTINNLKEKKLIEFHVTSREALIEAMATEYGVSFATDEDVREQAIEEVEEKMGVDSLTEDVTESEMFNHARKEIIKSFNGENIGGLYLVESLHQIAVRMKDFVLNCDLIDDVYGTDEELISFLVAKIRLFSPKKN